MKRLWQRKPSPSTVRELLAFGGVYFFMALINLRAKLFVTRAWYDGILERNHELLLAFQHVNPVQSRLLQFCIPELFRRLFGLSIPHAYILQRWLFVFLAFLCFHFYLKKWFDSRLAFAGVLILAASMPLSYFDHLQESSPLLLLTFLLALWAIRERRTFWYAVVLTVGAFNNETMLFLPAVYVFYNFQDWKFRHLVRLFLTTLGSCLPAYLVVGTIRYINRGRPQLGDLFWHWPDNIRGIFRHLRTFPLDYWKAEYLYVFFIFGVLWLYAFLRYSKKPLFLRRAALTIPLFLIPHLLATIIAEVRLMLPLSFIIIPMALFYLFPSDETESETRWALDLASLPARLYNAVVYVAQPEKNAVKVRPKRVHWLLLSAILLVAAFLRFYRLEALPRGPYYDEAANGILASEIATGQAYPLFIRSYTGKEVLWFYAVAAVMKVLGANLLSMRVTSALFGMATVALTYWLGLELFDEEDQATRHGIGLMAAALAAVNFWHIVISRYGFRAISQPLLQALMLLFLWRGLRRGGLWNLVLAGLFCGATAYTYLSSRIVPIALLPWVVGMWIASRSQRRLAAGRILLVGLAAAVVFAPLGVFFLRNPETFGARMGQVSVFNPELNQGDVWRALWRSIGAALGMFTVRGDPQSRFGVIGRTVFDPVVGVFFYLGALVSLYKVWRGKPAERVLYLSTLLWVPLLLVPSILGVKEVPHSLRAIGVMPVMFYLPALGLSAATRWLAARTAGLRWLATPTASVVLAAILLVEGGILAGWDYFGVWGSDPVPYYENDNDLADAARTLNEIAGDREVWISAMHYRHPTIAFLANSYSRAHWLVDGQVLAFPPADGPGAIYVFSHLAFPDQSLLDLMDTVAEGERYLGPDGGLAYLVYQVPPGVVPDISPQYPASVNFGNQIELLGYDLPPTVAGESLYATFYWRVLGPPKAEDYVMFARLTDAWGLHWGSSDAFDYPSAEWRPGQVIVQRREVPVSAITPPGEYELVAGFSSRGQNARLPRLDPQGRVAGTAVDVGPVSISQAPTPTEDRPRIQVPLEAAFGDLRLLGFRRDQTSLRPGDVYYLGLFWESAGALPDLDVSLSLAPASGGDAVPLWSDRPVHGTYPTDAWPGGTVLLDQYGLTIPRDAPHGAYTLVLAMRERASGQRVGAPTSLTELEIQKVDRRTIVPPIQHPREANLGDQVAFLGYDLERTEVAPGETLYLTLYWRALSTMDTSYTVFSHLLDGANQIRGQQDNPPMNGTYPTTLWAPGEVVADEYALQVDADAQPGAHAIEIGLYVLETGQRLPVLDAAGQVTGDRILVSEVEVVGE